jgi:hypothetical protein
MFLLCSNSARLRLYCFDNCQMACKPGSVTAGEPADDGHSSGTPVARRLARPTRAAGRKQPRRRRNASCRPYLVLLPVGFALPRPLPAARCALTAPFHPCRRTAETMRRRFAFCGTFPGVAPAGRYPAPYFRGARTFLTPQPRSAAIRPSGKALGTPGGDGGQELSSAR